jgi:hypothetical protein
MTTRNPVSATQNIFFNGQEVDDSDLTLEQNYNKTIESGIIANQVGYGVLPEVLVQNTLFNSELSTGFLDGIAISTQNQPSDSNLGNQLSLTLSNSKVGGKKSVKVGIIGLDFQSNLQYETYYFFANETQVGQKHFTKILILLFNDFIGNPLFSLNLGGDLLIQEAQPMTLSRDTVMVSQTLQPNLFFRDFFLDGPLSLQTLLQNALPLYNINTLGITTQPASSLLLSSGDVTTQIGEKFITTTNNIQQITLLLSVQNLIVGQQNNLVWAGDLVISIYPLQTTVSSPSDTIPGSPIQFPPANVPVAQISYNYTSLQDVGIVLNSVPQPVPFVFSNSSAGAGTVISPNQYYAVTLKRSGSANACDIILSTGTNLTANSEVTMFTGDIWVDIPDQQLWFLIETDAAKISDGQAYENGFGVTIPKTIIDPATGVTVDYSFNNLQFAGGDIFSAVLSAITNETDSVPDPRTGEPILTRQQFVPQVKLLGTINLGNLETASEPLILGTIQDKNVDFINNLSNLIKSDLWSATIVNNEMLIRIVDDPTNPRFDTTVTALQSELLNGMFVGAQIFPNGTNISASYRIATARLCSYILGDVDGNGIIDQNDLNILNAYIGYNMNVGLPRNTIFNSNGATTSCSNGYTTLTVPFTNQFGIEFQLFNPTDGYVLLDGYDGVLVANPNDNTLAQFTSASVNFSNIVDLNSYQLMVITPSIANDYGAFNIISLNTTDDVITIQKTYLDGDIIGQMLRADVDGDFAITFNDGYLLNNYIQRDAVQSLMPFTTIGSTFNVIRFTLEQFIDRNDDFYDGYIANRAATIHPSPDIFLNDGYFAQHNFLTQPVPISIFQELVWEESLVTYNSHPKQVPTIFTYPEGFVQNSCVIEGINCSIYGSPPNFDPGRVDVFVPNNLIIGEGGAVENPDGSYFKVDFEVGTIVLEIPDGLFGAERTIDLLNDFIVDYTGGGVTKLGFPAMRFADCSTVSADAIINNQIRFSVAVQSFSPNTNGLSEDGYFGAIVDGKMGVSIDYNTGLLTINFTNLYQDAVLQTLSTKIQIDVFLKKGGFNNATLFVDATKVQNMLKLVSIFSGANVGGPSPLVNLATDVTGLLPSADVSYTPTVPGNWTSQPTTAQQALDDLAAGVGLDLTDPIITDGSAIVPSSLSSTTTNIVGVVYVAKQTTNATPVTVLTIPLPGTTGTIPGTGGVKSVPSTGSIWIDAEVKMVSKTTAVAATFKFSWGWAVHTSGSPVAQGSLVSILSTGTNAGAAPAGWAATMTLDGTSKNAIITITGDSSLVVNCSIRAECGYLG